MISDFSSKSAVTIIFVAVAAAANCTTLSDLLTIDNLFQASTPPEQIVPLAREFLDHVKRNPKVAPGDFLDLSSATLLYDRLLRSGLSGDDLVALIRDMVPCMPKLAWPIAGTTSSVSLMIRLLESVPPELFPYMYTDFPVAISVQILALRPRYKGGLQAAGCTRQQIADVVKRFHAPFNSVFPFNQQIAAHLLTQDGVCDQLRAMPETVTVLLRYGLRFSAASFLRHVRPSPSDLGPIYPLLMVGDEPGARVYDVMKAALDLDAVPNLLALSLFWAQFWPDAAWTVCFLALDLRGRDTRLVNLLLQAGQGRVMQRLVGVASPDRGLTLLHAAVRYKRFALIVALMGVDGVDLSLRDHEGRRALDYVSEWSRMRLLEFDIYRVDCERQGCLLPSELLAAVEQRKTCLEQPGGKRTGGWRAVPQSITSLIRIRNSRGTSS